MQRVLVICGAGASSTFLVHWMRGVAAERALDLVVAAGSIDDLGVRIEDADIVLVGEHLVDQFPEVVRLANAAGVHAAVLPHLSFDRQGAAVALDVVSEWAARPLVEVPSAAPADPKDSENHHG